MPRYLFDSNALIYSTNPAPAHDALRELLMAPPPSGAASAISMVEVLGFSRLTARDQELLEATFEALEIIPVSDSIILEAVALARHHGLKAADAVIAASALQESRTLVSADNHFQRIPGLAVIDPLHLP